MTEPPKLRPISHQPEPPNLPTSQLPKPNQLPRLPTHQRPPSQHLREASRRLWTSACPGPAWTASPSGSSASSGPRAGCCPRPPRPRRPTGSRPSSTCASPWRRNGETGDGPATQPLLGLFAFCCCLREGSYQKKTTTRRDFELKNS